MTNAAYVCEQIKAAKAVCILCHTRPDGDTLGSAFALARVCRVLGTPARVLLADPPAARLSFLCCPDFLAAPGQPDELVISVDVASPAQLGSLCETWCDRVDLKIDHHATAVPFGRFCWVEPDAAATGELIYEIAREAGARDARTADLIYAAVCSDTGGFRYSNTTARSFGVAADLILWGANVADVAERLFDRQSVGECRAIGDVYANMRFACGGRLVSVLIPAERRAALGTTEEDYSNASALLRTVEGVELSVSIRQQSDQPTKYRVSMRSRDPIDCAALCARLGGGGHVRAAGATLTAPGPAQAEEQIIRLCAEVFHA